MKPNQEPPQIDGRLQSIDALRGIAALGVVLYHAVMQTTNAVPDNFFRWPVKLLQFVSSFGYIGVFLFFVISGFCIHLQWAKSRATGKPHQIEFRVLLEATNSPALSALPVCPRAVFPDGGPVCRASTSRISLSTTS